MEKYWLLLFVLISSSLLAQDFTKCDFKVAPEVIKLEGCEKVVCVGKAKCQWDPGPVMITLGCTIKQGEQCPNANKCAQDSNVSFSQPTIFNGSDNSSESGSRNDGKGIGR